MTCLNQLQTLWVSHLFHCGTQRIQQVHDAKGAPGIDPRLVGALRRRGMLEDNKRYAMLSNAGFFVAMDAEAATENRWELCSGWNWGP